MKDKILPFLLSLPRWAKIVVIAAAAACAVVVLFCSCSATSKLPDVSDYKVGAEGVVSKEKNVTKQTKWYFKPETEVEP